MRVSVCDTLRVSVSDTIRVYLVLFSLAVVAICVSSRQGSADDNVDDLGILDEMSALEKELQMGKRNFQMLWRNLTSRGRDGLDDAALGVYRQKMVTLRTQTRRMRYSLSRSLRSLDDFVKCYNSCLLQNHVSTSTPQSASDEGRKYYFCNHMCFQVSELHTTDPDQTDSSETSARPAGMIG